MHDGALSAKLTYRPPVTGSFDAVLTAEGIRILTGPAAGTQSERDLRKGCRITIAIPVGQMIGDQQVRAVSSEVRPRGHPSRAGSCSIWLAVGWAFAGAFPRHAERVAQA